MNSDNKHRILWGSLLIIEALGVASLRNIPALGITPLAIALIEGMIYMFFLSGVRVSSWKMAAINALIVPVYLWKQRFLDGYMVPVDMLVNLTMVACMCIVLRLQTRYPVSVLLLFVPSVLVMLLGGTVALWLVKEKSLLRSFIFSWNTDIYSYLSLLGATLICAPFHQKKARS